MEPFASLIERATWPPEDLEHLVRTARARGCSRRFSIQDVNQEPSRWATVKLLLLGRPRDAVTRFRWGRHLQPPSPSSIASDVTAAEQLYTYVEAAERLGVTESWMRTKSKRREIPRTELSPRKIRFSEQNLVDIIAAGQQPPRPARAGLRPDDLGPVPVPRPKRHRG